MTQNISETEIRPDFAFCESAIRKSLFDFGGKIANRKNLATTTTSKLVLDCCYEAFKQFGTSGYAILLALGTPVVTTVYSAYKFAEYTHICSGSIIFSTVAAAAGAMVGLILGAIYSITFGISAVLHALNSVLFIAAGLILAPLFHSTYSLLCSSSAAEEADNSEKVTHLVHDMESPRSATEASMIPIVLINANFSERSTAGSVAYMQLVPFIIDRIKKMHLSQSSLYEPLYSRLKYIYENHKVEVITNIIKDFDQDRNNRQELAFNPDNIEHLEHLLNALEAALPPQSIITNQR